MHPTSKRRFIPAKFPELFTDGITLKRETTTKVLGAFIDKNTISTKVSKSIDILYGARFIIPRKQLNQLYFSFVHSYLNYANLALSTLYRQQKHSIRLLRFKDLFIDSRPLFKTTGALNIYETNIFNILCLMFKYKKKACLKAFKNLFTLKPKNEYRLKKSCTLLEPFCKSKFSQLCINYRVHIYGIQ